MKNEFAVKARTERFVPQPAMPRREHRGVRERTNAWVAWLALIGILVPAAEVQINAGGAKFTVGRLAILLLIVPALTALLQRGRRLQLPDFFACATSLWMIVAAVNAGNPESISSSIAEVIEFGGGYLVARAFFFGPLALQTFVRVLKIIALVTIVLGMADSLTGRMVIHEALGSIFQIVPIEAQYRGGVVRAASTFDHAILFGAFCAFVATILLYAERELIARVCWVAACFFGCILSWSSSGLMSFILALGLYSYDCVMKRYSWRWGALCTIVALSAAVFFLASNNPMGWIISHLTLDPVSGFFRFMIWDAATAKISESPTFGFGFASFNNGLLDLTVDSVWLVMALRFGIPMVVLLILMVLTGLLPVRRIARGWPGEHYMSSMSTGFTMVLVLFMFVGLTVHYWNYFWIFWGICIGIRVSINEYKVVAASRPVATQDAGSHYPRPTRLSVR